MKLLNNNLNKKKLKFNWLPRHSSLIILLGQMMKNVLWLLKEIIIRFIQLTIKIKNNLPQKMKKLINFLKLIYSLDIFIALLISNNLESIHLIKLTFLLLLVTIMEIFISLTMNYMMLKPINFLKHMLRIPQKFPKLESNRIITI